MHKKKIVAFFFFFFFWCSLCPPLLVFLDALTLTPTFLAPPHFLCSPPSDCPGKHTHRLRVKPPLQYLSGLRRGIFKKTPKNKGEGEEQRTVGDSRMRVLCLEFGAKGVCACMRGWVGCARAPVLCAAPSYPPHTSVHAPKINTHHFLLGVEQIPPPRLNFLPPPFFSSVVADFVV